MSTYIPSGKPIVDPRTGAVDIAWLKFFDKIDEAITTVAWTSLNFAGSSLADLVTRSAAALNAGTLPLARLSGITNTELSAAAAIAWSKISKSGGLLSDLASQATTTSTGNQDNINFGNVDSLLCNNASAVTWRGFLAGASGQRLTLTVINAQVDLAHQDANSSAANRIITPTAATVTLTRFADLSYDGQTLRWRVGAYA